MASSSSSLCPSFCPSTCAYRHHELLLALIDCCDLQPGPPREAAFHSLKTVISRCEQTTNWAKDLIIPDDYVAYRFPMMHWACVLGQPCIVEWLVKQGFSSAVQQEESGDTGLHRVFVCMQTSSTKEPDKVINSMLPYLTDCFMVKNKNGNTPFHLACELLHADTTWRNNKFFAGCIKSILETAKIVDTTCDLVHDILDSQNNEGNTPAHILAQHDRNVLSLKLCVSEGASLLLENKLEINALDVAINCGQTKNSKYLDAQWKIQKSCLDPKTLPKPQVFKHSTLLDSSVKGAAEKPSTSSNGEDEIKILPRLRKKRKRLSTESSEETQQYMVTTTGLEDTSTSKVEEQDSSDETVLLDCGIPDIGKHFLAYLQHADTETRSAIIKTIKTDRHKIQQQIDEYTDLISGYRNKHQALKQQRDLKHELLNHKLEEVLELQQEIGDVENKLLLLENIHRTGPQTITSLKTKLKSCEMALGEIQTLSGCEGDSIVID